MASIVLDLSQFKASGIYTIEYDQSINIVVQPQTIRLVVGFSKKGPFNTPVFCRDIKTARQVFGDIDYSLERKGSFFHRSMFTCLQTGPIFALNLMIINDDEVTSPDASDKTNYRSFSIDTAETNGVLTPRLVSSFYNKERFWFTDPSYFLATVSTLDENKFLHLTNLGRTTMSVIIRKTESKVFDLTAKEWYQGNKPDFLQDTDYISDFFVDVIAVEGDWTNYAQLSIDPIYSKYFSPRGMKKDMVKEFIARGEVNLVCNITGSLIPDFRDKNNVVQDLETLLNRTTGFTGMFAAVNKKAYDDITNNASQIDLVGHNLISSVQTSIDMISYRAPLFSDYVYADILGGYVVAQSPYDVIIADETTEIYDAYIAGDITDGDYIIKDNVGTKQYLRFFRGVNGSSVAYVEIRAYDSAAFAAQEDIASFGTTYDSAGSLVATDLNIVSVYGTYNQYFSTVAEDPAKPLGANDALLSASDAAIVRIGDLLVDSSGTRLTRVLRKVAYDLSGNIRVSCASPVKVFSSNRVRMFKRLQDYVQDLQFTYLSGFAIKETAMPNGTNTRQNEILDVLYNTNLSSALKSRNLISYRYIVDTFNAGLEENSKSRLAKIAMERRKALALLNTPTFAEFASSTDPRFTDAPTNANPKPIINMQYIIDGGNQDLGPSFSYTLVDENNGAKYCGYFAPNLILRDQGRNISVPPAAHVSNLFVQKFINGTPYAIAAGPKRGVIYDVNLVGVEYDLSDEDRALLEPFGINPIIRERGVGVMVYANQTGYQRVQSALNNLHVRDLLITIETDIEDILRNYIFEFNDASTRLEVKTRVDNYLEAVQAGGGLYNYETVMDTSNNTPEIIDANMGIIDVIVEPAHGIHKFINRVTITKTGGVGSGGFSTA